MSRSRKDTPQAKRKRWETYGVNSWPVPSDYKRGIRGEERTRERELLHRLKEDPESDPLPDRKHKNDYPYYW